MSSPKDRLSKRTLNPLPCTASSDTLIRKSSSKEISAQKNEGSGKLKHEFWDLLRYNKELLDEYVIAEVPQETIEKWMIRKASLKAKKQVQSSLSNWKFCVHSDKQKMLNDLLPAIECGNKSQLLLGLSYILKSATKADHFHLYSVTNKETLVPVLSEKNEECMAEYKIQVEDTVAGYAAATGQMITTNAMQRDLRFPNGIAFKDCLSQAAASLIVVPLLTLDNDVIGVLELIRMAGRPQFNLEEMEIVGSYMTWVSVAFNYSFTENISLKQKQKLNSSLLEIFKLIVDRENDVDLDTILQSISDQALSLFQADESYVFLLDEPSYGDLGLEIRDCCGIAPDETDYNDNLKEFSFKKGSFVSKHSTKCVSYREEPIRFPFPDDVGISVIRTGEVLLFEDVGNDSRFTNIMVNGCKIRSILCAPLKIKGKVYGIIELMKTDDSESFIISHKTLFTEYAEQCSGICAAAKANVVAKSLEQQYRVTAELLAYHRQAETSELEKLKLAKPLPEHWKEDLLIPNVNILALNDMQFLQTAFLMFSQLAQQSGLSRYFNDDIVLRFILTVSKNYRPVPYHGWYHGLWVAQSMFAVINNHPSIFTGLERIAFFTACICHDLDHRGYTNSFYVQTKAPLATLYSTSIMENHHFNQMLAILRMPGLDIFSEFDPVTFKNILQSIRHAIIATDLALLANSKAKVEKLVEDKSFNWSEDTHREAGVALLMVGCDVSATSRPWVMHKTTVDWLMEEFYKQGDEEKARGFKPMQLMDKDYSHMLPSFQIGFMNAISLPCYTLLAKILPCSKIFVEGTKKNIESWTNIKSKNSDK